MGEHRKGSMLAVQEIIIHHVAGRITLMPSFVATSLEKRSRVLIVAQKIETPTAFAYLNDVAVLNFIHQSVTLFV
jgi:hypothetical protein